MDKKVNMELLASYGILHMVKKIANNLTKPDHEVIRDIRDLLDQVDEEVDA